MIASPDLVSLPMPRVLIVAPTDAYRVGDFVRAAESLGVEVSVASEQPLPYADPEFFVQIDCRDPATAADRLYDLAVRTPIDAIIAIDDRGVAAAARASERLGLPHHSARSVETTLDKLELRQVLAGSEVSQPSFVAVPPDSDGTDAFDSFGGSVVVKPTGLSASRGVIRVDRRQDVPAVVERIRSIQADAGLERDAPLLMERYVDGVEVAVEAISFDGDLEVLAIFDKPDRLEGPFFEETIYVTPSRLPKAQLIEVERVTRVAAARIGLDNGPIHAELRLAHDVAYLIEIAARTIGGSCSRSLGFGLSETSLETLVLRHALGMRKHLGARPGSSGVMMLPIPRSGTLASVSGRAECLATPGIVDLEISIPIGERVVALPEGDRYLGFLFARAETPTEVEAALRAGHSRLNYQID